MILDVLFYSALVWMVLYIIRFFRRQPFPPKLLWISLPLNASLGVALWIFYLVFSFAMGFRMIGRGHIDTVYVDSANGRESLGVFAPYVSIPLDEVIEYYGEPEEVWFLSDRAPDVTGTGLLLNWDSVRMYVQLPPVADGPYPVRRKTAIERIIFYDDRDVAALAGQQLEEKTPWRGYGNYQP